MKINGVTVKTPSSMQVDIMDIDSDSYRTAKGNLVRDRVAVKRKIACSWNWLTIAECSTLLQAVEDEFVELTYLDPKLGTVTTKTVYVGDRTSPVYSFVDGKEGWKGVQMTFTEK